jgi:trans-4-hydroxy-L-proline dehydratase
MNERTKALRRESLEAVPAISQERAEIVTDFYVAHEGKYSPPVMRAMCFHAICSRKVIYIGERELIVGERGPSPKVVPTFPELTCHSLEDLQILCTREKTNYEVPGECRRAYEERIIPYWRGRSMRDRLFATLPDEWKDAYEAGIFTEFMEQRAPGHTVLDDKIYKRGLADFRADIAAAIAGCEVRTDPESWRKREQWIAMDIACDAVIVLARRHAERAIALAEDADPVRRRELFRIAEVCRRVPEHLPRDFWEALQAYWFCHVAVITELNGWDAFSPGHLDQHLLPFYRKGIREGTLTEQDARELLEAFIVKFNNHPAPPKVGVTAAESGTYTDFANLNLGGVLDDGTDGSSELTGMLLDVIDDLHLLQPSSNLQLSRKTPDEILRRVMRVVRKGYGFPSIFNADAVVAEQLRVGKTIEDARAGGCSGCVETGAFGKEAYILTGYFNLAKIMELALHDGVDPRTGKNLGPHTGDPARFETFEDVLEAFRVQLAHFIDLKILGNSLIEQLYSMAMPAPFLSVLIDDCISKGKDYNSGGARYNNSYIQFVGIGSLTDSLSAIKEFVFDERLIGMKDLMGALDVDFTGTESLRLRLVNRARKYGNDDDAVDALMIWAFDACFRLVDGRPNAKGGQYRIQMLPTTCHIYFGSVTGAMPDGRRAGLPLSEGISPVQGADRRGPTAVFKSAAKMDHLKTGGTLLNMKFSPGLIADDGGLEKLAALVRGYFRLDGHHVQFNVVNAETLRKAQLAPQEHRSLIVRVAGYSDYFCDLPRVLQDEIIARTEHAGF